jgi:hypothetical protein
VPKGYDESTEWLDVCSCMKPDFEIVFVGVWNDYISWRSSSVQNGRSSY